MAVDATVTAAAAPAPPPDQSTERRSAALLPRLALAAAAGLILDAAFAPIALSYLALIATALLVLVVRGTTVRQGAWLGAAFGLGFFLPLLHWSGSVAGPGAWLALVLLQTALVIPLGAGLALVTRLPGWPIWTAAVWVADEALRSRVPFGGFPWGRLAFSQPDTVLTPLAAVGGAPLVTFAVALVGGSLALALVRPARRELLFVVPGLVLVSAAVLIPTPTDGPMTRVAVVQGNVPRLGLDFNAQRSAVLRNHVAATRDLAAAVRAGTTPRPDIVIWPENASDIDPFEDAEAYRLIDDAVRDIGVPVLVGTLIDAGAKVDNAGVVWDPVTGPGARYVKRHPVPFGEYMPFRSLLRKITTKVDLVPRDFRAGQEPGVLDVGPVRLGDVICFEVAYDALVRDVVTGGGRLLVVQTNNATFGRSGETEQQLAMGRVRAVEHGRSLLVAATSGVSAVFAPDGRTLGRAEVFTRDVLVHDVPLRSAQTLATRVGGAPEAVLALVGLLALGLAAVRR